MSSADGPNLEAQLQMGITAAKQGNKEGARVILRQVIQADPQNDRAWYWLAYLADTNAQRRQFLQSALKANPNNQNAQKALTKMATRNRSQEQRTLIIGVLFLFGVLAFAALLILVVLVAR
ncbi:MAG: tetratricopeptide repeat protein [Anaerolineales bacterium]